MVDFGIGETALVMTLMSGAISAGGAAYSGMASAATYNYQAGVAQMNAQIAKQNAAYETALGEVQAQQQGMKTRATISQTRAVQGASGLDVNTGSAASVRSSEFQLGGYDQQVIRAGAARRAYGFEVEAVGDVAQANLDRMAARNSENAGMLKAFTSILGAGGSFASKWKQGQSTGIVPDAFGGE
jgi:hypothetical protein